MDNVKYAWYNLVIYEHYVNLRIFTVKSGGGKWLLSVFLS